MILTANRNRNVIKSGGYLAFINAQINRLHGPITIDLRDKAGEVAPQVIRSQWVVECPWCAGAIVVNPGSWYLCVECLNADNSGKVARIIDPPDRTEVERLLNLRPNFQNRNWLTGETVENIRAENIAHGIGV